MKYRRFGKTEIQIPVITSGGMRYMFKWQDISPSEIPSENQDNLEACIGRALDLGINHFETARAYGTSETQLGKILPALPRDKIIVQTKGTPQKDPNDFLKNFESSLNNLGLEYVDLFTFHGVNNEESYQMMTQKGGCLEIGLRLLKEGRCSHLGFSSHGSNQLMKKIIELGVFEYTNLHWYFINPHTWEVIDLAAKKDMGVFIISPNDKGGKLYNPTDKMSELCAPLTPMQFNDLFCLSREEVHTLSIGASRASDFDQHVDSLQYYEKIKETIEPIESRIQLTMNRQLGKEWMENWYKKIPKFDLLPGEVNVFEILRLWTYAAGLDLHEFAGARYNMLSTDSSWFPGNNAGNFNETAIKKALKDHPLLDQIPHVLRECHKKYYNAQAHNKNMN